MNEPASTYEKAPQPVEWHLDLDTSGSSSKFLDGSPIKGVRLEVTHGTGQVEGTNWISLSLTLDDERIVSAGGYKIKDGEFYTLTGDRANIPGNIIRPIFEKLETHLKENPEDLEKINQELQK